MMVSVIIPVYHVAPYIEACLASVGRQTYPDVECVIVDDCGADDSMLVAERFIDDYRGAVRFVVVRQSQNSGLSSSRNLGMSVAAGDFVFFLDGDDTIAEDCLSQLVSVQRETGADCVVGSYRQVYADGTTRDFVAHKPCQDVLMAGGVEWPAVACNMLLRKRFLEQWNLRFETGILHEDLLWTFNLLIHRPVMAFSSAITYFYLQRSASIMTSNDEEMMRRRLSSYQKILQLMRDRCLRTVSARADGTEVGAAFFVERSARLMASMMLQWGQRDAAYRLFCYAKEEVRVPWHYCFLPSRVRWKDKLKLLYRLLPTRLAFYLFSSFAFHER